MTAATAEKMTVFEALSKVMADVQAVKKGDRNTQQNYNFRGIDAVVNAVGPKLREYGVICVPIGVTSTYRDVQTTTGKPSRECTVTARYRFYGPAGDFIDTEVPGEAMDSGDKGTPKAMSVAYRTLLLQALCIPTDEADPDHQSYERDAQTASPPPASDISVARAHMLQASKELGYGSDPKTIGDAFQEKIGKPVPEATVEDIQRFVAHLREDAAARDGQQVPA